MNIYGYIRVSSTDQKEDRQLLALKELDVPNMRIYLDKQSGKDFQRPQYKKMLKKIQRGDLLYILSIDRLGRNYEEVQKQWRILTKEIGADVCVLDTPALDTRRARDLIETLISDVILQVLSFGAQVEREHIRQRQEEGIRAAKLRGVKFGRPRKELPGNFAEICSAYCSGTTSLKAAAESCGMAKTTFYDAVCRERNSASCIK